MAAAGHLSRDASPCWLTRGRLRRPECPDGHRRRQRPVAAEIDSGDAETVGPGSPRGFIVSVLSATALTATVAGGYRFARWTLSGPSGLTCTRGTETNICKLAASSLSADATATATFGLGRPPHGGAWVRCRCPRTDPHTADPYAPGAFEEWDGSREPACDVSPVMADEDLPVAVFRPFVIDGLWALDAFVKAPVADGFGARLRAVRGRLRAGGGRALQRRRRAATARRRLSPD